MSDGKIRPEEYVQTQAQVLAIAAIVNLMPLEQFLRALNGADTVGPIVDPTGWQSGHLKMDGVRRLAEALLPLQAEAQRQARGAESVP